MREISRGEDEDRSTDRLMLHSDPEVAEMRRRAVSKAAWRFLPILTIAYVLNYLDRTSVGIAALTMNRDLGLTAYEFGWGAGYTHRVAISNRRLLAFNEASVTFRYKDYRRNGEDRQQVMTASTSSSAASCFTSCHAGSTASVTTACSPLRHAGPTARAHANCSPLRHHPITTRRKSRPMSIRYVHAAVD